MMSQGSGNSKVHKFELKVGTCSRDVTQSGGGGTLGVTHKCDVREGGRAVHSIILGEGGGSGESETRQPGGSARPPITTHCPSFMTSLPLFHYVYIKVAN